MATHILIDLSSITHPIYHATASDPNPNATKIQSLERIYGLASGQPKVAIACDSKRSERKEADPTYKANRKDADRAALYHQTALVIEQLQRDGFPIWAIDGLEADDVIASATKALLQIPDATVQIVSADKDLLALVEGDRVTIKSLRDGSIIDAAAVQARFNVRPDQIPDYLCLTGDASDNIKGADKIGPVTAARLLNRYETLEGIYTALQDDETIVTPAIRDSLRAFMPRVDDVRNLVRLRADQPLPLTEILVDRKQPTFDDLAPEMDDSDDDFSFDTPTGMAPGTVFDTPTGLPPGPPLMGVGPEGIPRLSEQDKVAKIPQPPVTDMPAPVVVPLPTPPPVQAMDMPAPAPPAPPTATRGRGRPRKDGQPTPAPQAHQTADQAAAQAADEVAAKVSPADVPIDPLVEAKMRAAQAIVASARPKSAALVPQVINDYTRELEPRTIEDAAKLAKYAFESRLFNAYGSAQAVLMTTMAGRELGMPMLHALRAFHIIEGKPVLSADALRALVMRSGLATYFRVTERTHTRATFVTQRGTEPEIALTYTIDDAHVAGLVKPGSGWVKNPSDMLIARAGSKLARLVYPDVVHGIYCVEEMDNQ